MKTQDSIIDKVRKLLRLAGNNNSPEEAALAAAKAQALIDEHSLSAALLAYDGVAPEPDEPVENFGEKGAWLHADTWIARWRYTLASVIAKANGCYVYGDDGNISLVGRPSDADTVRYLFAYCAGEVDRLTNAHGRGCGTTWRNNFRLGVVDTIARKLREQRAAKADQLRREASDNSQALVRVNTALAKIEQRAGDVERWTKSRMKLVSRGASKSTYDPSARQAGRRAGESINVGSRANGMLA